MKNTGIASLLGVLILLLLPTGMKGQTIDFERDSLLRDLPYQNLLNILAVKVPGFRISPVETAEGDESATMTLRGMNWVPRDKTTTSSRQVNAPLVVVDGVIFHGNINEIDIADVSKVEILQDAVAQYGARATNGAILITTRKGQTGKPMVRMRAEAGLSGWSHRPEGVNEEWTDRISRKGIGQRYGLSVSGGTERLHYYVSGDFLRQEGILLGDDYRKLGGLAQMDYHPIDWLKLGVSARYTDVRLWGQTPRLQNAFWMGEGAQPYSQVPGYESWPNSLPDGRTVNPLIGNDRFDSYLYTDRNDSRHHFQGTAWASVEFPSLRGLSFQTSYSYRKHNDGGTVTDDPRRYVNTSWADDMDHPESHLSQTYRQNSSDSLFHSDWRNELRFERNLGRNHLSLGAAYDFDRIRTGTSRQIRNQESEVYHSDSWTRTDLSYDRIYVSASYSFDRRIFASLIGSHETLTYLTSNPPQTHRDFYYQAALAWIPMRDRLRLRLSYGSWIPQEEEKDLLIGRISKLEAGADIKFWDGRLTGTVESYYHLSRRGDFYPTWSSISNPPEYSLLYNQFSNTGVELTLHGIALPGDGFRSLRWESNLLFSVNRNRVELLRGESEGMDISDAIFYGYDNCYALGVDHPISGLYRKKDPALQVSDYEFFADQDPQFCLNLAQTIAWQKATLWFNLRWNHGGPDHFLGYDSVNQEWISRNFLKLNDLVLSYSICHWARVYLSGTNLLTFTHWPALDPENGGTVAPHPSSDRFVSLPTFRTLRLGAQFTF